MVRVETPRGMIVAALGWAAFLGLPSVFLSGSEPISTPLLPSHAAAEPVLPAPDSPAATSPLSLAELEEYAITSNPTLRQAAAYVQQARGQWLQVGIYPNPVASVVRSANNAPFDAMNFFVSQDIPTAGKLGLNRAVAANEVQRALASQSAQRLKVLNEVKIRYWESLAAARRVETIRSQLTLADRTVAAAEQRKAAEVVSEADVLQAKLFEGTTRLRLANAERLMDAAWKRLTNAIGQPELLQQALAGDIEEAVPEISHGDALNTVLTQSPALTAARARVAAARTQVTRETVEPLPNLRLTSGIGRDYYQPEFMMYTINVGFAIPRSNRNQGNILAASGELQNAQAELSRLELELRQRLAEAFRRYETAKAETQTFRESIFPAANRNIALTLKAYEAGQADLIRVLTARRDYFRAQENYVDAMLSAHGAATEIEGLLLIGGLERVENLSALSSRSRQTSGPGQ